MLYYQKSHGGKRSKHKKLFKKVSKKVLTKLNECDKIIESARESADEKMDLEN